MKKCLLALSFLALSIGINAQITIMATSTDYFDAGETETPSFSEDKTQIFNISMQDNIFVHNIIAADGITVEDSQLYTIISKKEDDETTTILKTKSGLSGNVYVYYLILNDAGNYVLIQYFEDDGSMARFNGYHSRLKTIIQED